MLRTRWPCMYNVRVSNNCDIVKKVVMNLNVPFQNKICMVVFNNFFTSITLRLQFLKDNLCPKLKGGEYSLKKNDYKW